MYALCWAQVRKVGFWDRLDLDQIFTEGDKSCITLNKFGALSVDHLPRFVRVYDTDSA